MDPMTQGMQEASKHWKENERGKRILPKIGFCRYNKIFEARHFISERSLVQVWVRVVHRGKSVCQRGHMH